MSIFGGLFDINSDRNIDSLEEALGYIIFEEVFDKENYDEEDEEDDDDEDE